MKIARYWTRAQGEAVNSQGGRIRVTARGWSDDSFDSARMRAQDTARRVAQRIAAQPGAGPRYPYGDRPLPEPILSEFRDGGRPFRSDHPQFLWSPGDECGPDDVRGYRSPGVRARPARGSQDLFAGLFGKPAASPVKVVDPVLEAVGKVAERQRVSARVYRSPTRTSTRNIDGSFLRRSASTF